MPHRHRCRDDAETRVSAFCADLVDHGPSLALRHPGLVVRVVVALHALPMQRVAPGPNPEGRAIRGALTHLPLLARLGTAHAVSALRIPAGPGAYAASPGRQTLRRKMRRAGALEVVCSRVVDPDAQRALLRIAADRERQHPIAEHRYAHPRLDELLDFPLWLIAQQRGRPVGLAVIPVDGHWGLIRYLRALDSSEAASCARYALTEAAVEHARERGARFLLDERSPFGLPNGLRHFQRMLGWRIVRARAVRQHRAGQDALIPPAGPRAAATAPRNARPRS